MQCEQANYTLVYLANGTCSVRSLAHRETFHPVIGPVAEAQALYVRQGEALRRMNESPQEFVIWDVGLGAAANALTILRSTAEASGRLRLVSFDHTLEPLRFALQHASNLGYFSGYEKTVSALLEQRQAVWQEAGRTVRWELHLADFPALLGVGNNSTAGQFPPARHLDLPKPHLIMFDAYSPAKNPAMWTQSLFARIYELLDRGRPCALATYSRSTMLRVSLLLAGFYVGGGQATGEKEETTLAANTPALISHPLDRRWLHRAHRSTSAEPLWEPQYRQAPLSPGTWERLQNHPQFN